MTDSSAHDKIPDVYFFILILAGLWCLAIIAAPILSHLHYKASSGLIYYFFSDLCHQMPQRSISIFNKQLAVCSRCTGLYFGFLAGLISYPVFNPLRKAEVPHKLFLVISGIPISLDIALQLMGIWHNTEISRFITGFILGHTTAWYTIPGLCMIKWNKIFGSFYNEVEKLN